MPACYSFLCMCFYFDIDSFLHPAQVGGQFTISEINGFERFYRMIEDERDILCVYNTILHLTTRSTKPIATWSEVKP